MARCLWELKRASRFSGCCSRKVLFPKCSCCAQDQKSLDSGGGPESRAPGSLFGARSARHKATVDYAYVSNALTREPSPHRFLRRAHLAFIRSESRFRAAALIPLRPADFGRRSRILRSGLTLCFAKILHTSGINRLINRPLRTIR